MDIDKINTSFPLQISRQPSSDLSSSLNRISYSSGNTSPEMGINTNECPSLASDIDTSSPSEISSASSPPNPGGPLSAAFIGCHSNSNLINACYRVNSNSKRDQRGSTKMSLSNGILQDRRGQLPAIASYPRSSESSNWRASTADIQEHTTRPPTASLFPTVTMGNHHSFSQGPQPTAPQYPSHTWPVSQPLMSTFPRTTPTSFHGGNTSSGPSGSALRLDLNHLPSQDFYGYGFDRGGGKITLLVPVDVLPPVTGVPQTLPDHAGIVILPPPQRRGPQGLSSNPGPLAFRVSRSLEPLL